MVKSVLLKFVSCFQLLFNCSHLWTHSAAFASIRFHSIRFALLYYHIEAHKHRHTHDTHIHQVLNSRATWMHLRCVSISILIVANGNIRVDLNRIAWCSMVWHGLVWYCGDWRNKVNTLNNDDNDHVHESPTENPYKKENEKAHRIVCTDMKRERERESNAETIEWTEQRLCLI